ncbi:MAG: helix-turn-helix transcriptional regulator [Acidaminococcaceae bacterium]
MLTTQYRKIGAIIAYYRKLRGFTQANLAEKSGFSTSYISQIERGLSEGVPLATYMLIARELNVELEDLFYVIKDHKVQIEKPAEGKRAEDMYS